MARSVAAAGDLVPVPAVGWAPQLPVITVPHDRLVVDGQPAIAKATCTFVSSQAGVPPEVIVLEPPGTVLSSDGNGVLAHGDQQRSEATGNMLKVVVTAPGRLAIPLASGFSGMDCRVASVGPA
jgi:hypothetical protein